MNAVIYDSTPCLMIPLAASFRADFIRDYDGTLANAKVKARESGEVIVVVGMLTLVSPDGSERMVTPADVGLEGSKA